MIEPKEAPLSKEEAIHRIYSFSNEAIAKEKTVKDLYFSFMPAHLDWAEYSAVEEKIHSNISKEIQRFTSYMDDDEIGPICSKHVEVLKALNQIAEKRSYKNFSPSAASTMGITANVVGLVGFCVFFNSWHPRNDPVEKVFRYIISAMPAFMSAIIFNAVLGIPEAQRVSMDYLLQFKDMVIVKHSSQFVNLIGTNDEELTYRYDLNSFRKVASYDFVSDLIAANYFSSMKYLTDQPHNKALIASVSKR